MLNFLKALPVRRSLATAAVTLVIVVVAINAGFWQYGRYEDRADALQAYDAASGLNAVALDTLVQPGALSGAEQAVWRTATVTGTFVDGPAVELRNRPVDSTPSIQYLAWFETDTGGAILVNTGWVPAAEAASIPDLNQGQVDIEVVLRDWEEDDGRRDAGATRITPAQLPATEMSQYPVYGMLRHACDSPPCYSPEGLFEVPLPYLSTGPHLSYAWQWWVFAGLAPVGAVILLRRDAEELDDSTERLKEPKRKRAPSDEEIEDAL